GGINYVYVKNKISFYGGYYYNKKNINGDRIGDARILQENGSYYHMVASGERPEWFENYAANYGLDFRLSKKSVLSAAYYYGRRTEGRSAFYVYNNFYGDIDKNPIDGIPVENEWIYNPNTDNRYGIFHSANIDYSINFENSSSLAVSFLYEHSSLTRKLDNKNYAYDKPSETIGGLQEHFRQSDDTPLDGFRISLDYDKKLSNGHNLAFGLQPQFLHHEGTFSYDTLNVENDEWGNYEELENAIDLYRGVYSGYADYSGKSDRFEFALGLRLEYTDQTLDLANPDYFSIFDRPTKSRYEVNQLDWFPTLHMNLVLSDTDALIFAASRRINRPPTKNMAPFLYRRHFEVYLVGDPALEPEYISNLELTYNKDIGNQNFALTGFYRGTDNAVFRVNTVYQEENVLIRSYTNAGNTKSLGAELNSNLVATPDLKIFVGGSLYNYRVAGDIFGYQENNQSTNWSLKGNANWMASDVFKLTVDFDFKSATVTAQGANELFYLANLAINYTPQKLEGWSFALRGIDLLASNVQGLNTRAFNSEGVQIFYQEVQYNRYGPIVEVGVNYSINMYGKSKKKAKSTFGDEQF
ncbi:MAG: TonB-dependent receptor family protein, partial [Cyclobacteriaceae bacterium]|nr:TonB-dependent receptor family protein [Cyclobacteriaceae bacterium]